MATAKEKIRLQIPVSAEFASRVAKLGECFRWSQSTMAAALLEEGVRSKEKWDQWFDERLADALNMARGNRRVKIDGDPTVYLQTFVNSEVAVAIERMAVGLNNSPARVAAMLLDSAAHDNGWMIEVLGSGPGQTFVKLLKSLKVRTSGKIAESSG